MPSFYHNTEEVRTNMQAPAPGLLCLFLLLPLIHGFWDKGGGDGYGGGGGKGKGGGGKGSGTACTVKGSYCQVSSFSLRVSMDATFCPLNDIRNWLLESYSVTTASVSLGTLIADMAMATGGKIEGGKRILMLLQYDDQVWKKLLLWIQWRGALSLWLLQV